MELSDIRIKILPARFISETHRGRTKNILRGGEYVQMQPDEEPEGHWIHYERRDVTLESIYHSHLGPQPFPEGRKQYVAAILHYPDGTIVEHPHLGPDGIPAEKHPLEEHGTD